MTMTTSESAVVQRYVLRLGNQSLTLPIQVNAHEHEQDDEITMQLQSNNGQYVKKGKANGVNGTVEPMLTCGKREDALAILSVNEEFIFVVGGKVNKECENKVAAMQSALAEEHECSESKEENNCKMIKLSDELCNNKENHLITNVSSRNNCTNKENNDTRKRREEETIVLESKKKNNKKKKQNSANSLVKAIPETWLSYFPLVECYNIANKTWFSVNGHSTCNNNVDRERRCNYLQLKWPVRSGIAILPTLQESTNNEEVRSDRNNNKTSNNNVKLLAPAQVAFIGGWSSYKASRLSSMIVYPNVLVPESCSTQLFSSHETKQEGIDQSNSQLLAQLPRVVALHPTLPALCYHTCNFIRHSFYIFGGELSYNNKNHELKEELCHTSNCACSNTLYQITHPQLQHMYTEMMNASVNRLRGIQEQIITLNNDKNEKSENALMSNDEVKEELSKENNKEEREEGWICREITPLPFYINRENSISVHDMNAMANSAIRNSEPSIMTSAIHKKVENMKVRQPAPRASHCACVLQQRFLLIFGGRRIRTHHPYHINSNKTNNSNNYKSNSNKGEHGEFVSKDEKWDEEDENDEWDKEEEAIDAQVASLEEEREALLMEQEEQQQEQRLENLSSSKLRKNSASRKRKESGTRPAHSSRSGKDSNKPSTSEMKSNSLGKQGTKSLANAKISKSGMNRTGKNAKSDKTNSKYDSKGKTHYNERGENYNDDEEYDDQEEQFMWNENNGNESNISAQRHALPHFALYNDIAIFDTFTHQWLQVIVNANGGSEIPMKRYGAAMSVIPLCSLSTQNSPKRTMPHVNNNNNNINNINIGDSVSTLTRNTLYHSSFFNNQLQNLLDKAPNPFFTSPSASCTSSSTCFTSETTKCDDITKNNNVIEKENKKTNNILNGPTTNYIKNDVIWGAEVVMHGGIDSHGRVLNDAWVLQVLHQPLHTSYAVNNTKSMSHTKPTFPETELTKQQQELRKSSELEITKEDNKEEMALDPPSVTVQWIRLTALNATVTSQTLEKSNNNTINNSNNKQMNETKQSSVNYNNNNKTKEKEEEEEEYLKSCLPARAHHSLVVTTQREVYLIGGVSSLSGAHHTSSLTKNNLVNNGKNNKMNKMTAPCDNIKELCHFTIAPRAHVVKNVRRSSNTASTIARYGGDRNMNNTNDDKDDNSENNIKGKSSAARRNERNNESISVSKENKEDVQEKKEQISG